MTKIIAVANQKGGVGKTTTTVNLAYGLARAGKTVLAIDLDPQASLTISMGQDPRALEASEKTISYSLMDGNPLRGLIIDGSPAMIPSSIRLSKADMAMGRSYTPATILKKQLSPLVALYDYILIDCPPNLSLLTINGLTAADAVLVPVKTDYLSIMGVDLLLETVQQLRDEANPELEVLGCVPTMFKKRNNIDQEAHDAMVQMFDGIAPVFEPIRQSTHFDKSHVEGRAALSFGSKDSGAETYQDIANYIIHHYG
ncbi:MAG: AAA family ATPase [Candidatus Sedimenticola sp. (ex Thyasira tokunagai)]